MGGIQGRLGQGSAGGVRLRQRAGLEGEQARGLTLASALPPPPLGLKDWSPPEASRQDMLPLKTSVIPSEKWGAQCHSLGHLECPIKGQSVFLDLGLSSGTQKPGEAEPVAQQVPTGHRTAQGGLWARRPSSGGARGGAGGTGLWECVQGEELLDKVVGQGPLIASVIWASPSEPSRSPGSLPNPVTVGPGPQG